MRRLQRVGWLAVGLPAVAGLAACQVQVAAPDLSGLFGESGSLVDSGEDVPGAEVPGNGELPGEDLVVIPDPGSDRPGTLEDRLEDPGSAGEDLFEEPQPGNASCRSDQGCVSGICKEGFCRCVETWHCGEGSWCDGGATSERGTGWCLSLRGFTAGCRFHEQCQTGACDPSGYCAWCAAGGTGCEVGKVCCFGVCREGCLGCAVAPPPAPVYTDCASGCYDAEQQFCGPNGGEQKREDGQDCQFNDSWCLSGVCFSEDLTTSICAQCHDDADCQALHGGGVCIGGYCGIP